MPESDARSHTRNVVNQCLEFGSECDQYPNLSEGADRVGGQLRGNKECPFSGVIKSGRVWRKVPESDARCVSPTLTLEPTADATTAIYGLAALRDQLLAWLAAWLVLPVG